MLVVKYDRYLCSMITKAIGPYVFVLNTTDIVTVHTKWYFYSIIDNTCKNMRLMHLKA